MTDTKKEIRLFEYSGGRSVFGRTYVYFTCPFCGASVKAYVWSLSGSGKRCECGVLHVPGRSIKTVKEGGL